MITFVYGGSVSKSIFLPFELQCIRKELPVAGPVDAMRLEKSSRLRMIAERAGKKIHARG